MDNCGQNHSPTEHEVRSQLELILLSKEFNSCERLKKFLSYVVDETLAGRGEQIKAYSIGLDAFQLGQDFDPSLNTVVRVTAGRVRNKLERYYMTVGVADKIYIEIPKGGYSPLICHSRLANGADGAAATVASASTTVPATPAPAAQDAAPYSLEPQTFARQYKPTTIVLPFTNLSGDSTLAPFLQGLAEEIAIALNRYDEFTVFAPQALDIQSTDIWELAARVGGRFIINGSVQFNCGQLRLRVALVDSVSRSHIWSDKFESQLEPGAWFNVQDEITAQVVSRIADSFNFINRMQLKQEMESSLAGLEIYEAMLFYHYWIISLTPQHFTKAKEALEKALELEPRSASLTAMLADVYASHCQWNLNKDEETLKLSLQLAEQALELDSACHYANWAKAYNCYLRKDKENFLYYVNKTLKLNPSNTNIMGTSGVKLIMVGCVEEGLAMLQEALRLNPHIPCWYRIGPFIVSYLQGDYGAALAEAQHITTANFLWGPLLRAAAYGQLGKTEEGAKELNSVLKSEPEFKEKGYDAMSRLFFQPTILGKVVQGLTYCGFDSDVAVPLQQPAGLI